MGYAEDHLKVLEQLKELRLERKSCDIKRGYKDETFCKCIIKRMKKQRLKFSTEKLNYYKCKCCGLFHIGNMNSRHKE